MSKTLQRACAEIVCRAVEDGVCAEAEAWHMTPGELSRRISACSRAKAQRMKDMDLAAWLAGQYIALALNAPGRYPPQPDRVIERAVGDNDMRELMHGIAGRG